MKSADYAAAYTSIRGIIASNGSDASHFATELRSRRIPHISFSRISCIQFCLRRYFLEYVAGVTLDPPPPYFVKGSLFHKAVAAYYRDSSRGARGRRAVFEEYTSQAPGFEARIHLENALEVMLRNAWVGWDVVAVEEPFVVEICSDAPPCVGVVDLLLKNGSSYVVVDHKTGSKFLQTDFYDPSRLQMTIYREFVREKYRANHIRFFYDKYRWVENLARIRKPAISREELVLEDKTAAGAIRQLKDSHRSMLEHERLGTFPGTGNCFACPFNRRGC